MIPGSINSLMMGVSSPADPYWSSVTLLMHLDGSDGGTTFTDQKGHTVTSVGNAVTSTAQSKFGGASGLFATAAFTASQATTVLTVTAVSAGTLAVGQNVWLSNGSATTKGKIVSLGTGTGGTGTYNLDTSATISSTTMLSGGLLQIPNSTDFEFGTGDFTVECWFRTGVISTTRSLISYSKNVTASNADIAFRLDIESSKTLTSFYNGATQYTVIGSTTLSNNTWYYYKAYRSGTTITVYINDTSQGTVAMSTAPNTPGSNWELYIGSEAEGYRMWDGNLDDMRITKGVARTGATTPTAPFPDH